MPTTQPFIRTREVMMGNAVVAFMERKLLPLGDKPLSVTPEIFSQYSIENWDLPKLRRYCDMLKAFGYNSIQFCDVWQNYVGAGWGQDKGRYPKSRESGFTAEARDWPAKLDAISDYARSIGLRTTLFIWGNAPFDYRTGRLYWAACPNDAAERQVLDQYWDHQVHHAPHFDHFVTHWGDPGGCALNGCTIETAQRIHADLLNRFRKLNPRIESSFSLWMLADANLGRWSGYKGIETFAKNGILPGEVMLSVHATEGDLFNEKEIRDIVASGRRAGMWTWYCVNNEIRPSLYGRTRALKKFFDAFPGDTPEILTWQSIDNNSHVLNMDSLYICARLMIARTADPKAAQREFLAGALGPENAADAQQALEGIEMLRPMWPDKYGDEAIDAGLARQAEAAARRVKIAPGFAPAFAMPVSPAQYAEEIVKQTEALREFANFSIAAAEVETMKAKGASEAAFEAALRALPEVTKPTRWMTNLEWCRRLVRIESLRKGGHSRPALSP